MRLAIDTVIALMLVSVLGGVVMAQRREKDLMEQVAAVQHAMRAIQAQALYRGAVNDAEVLPNGYVRQIESAWFDDLPENLLIGIQTDPWLDYATPQEQELFHPLCIVADGQHAAFWYNPHRGTVRARVPMQLSQEQTVDRYNLVNGSAIGVQQCRWHEVERSAATAKSATPAADGKARSSGQIVHELPAPKTRIR